jgi:hypothetical protein
MIYYHACSNCHARVRRSRIGNVIEFVISPIVVPYRCTVCDRRELKYRYLDMNPDPSKEEDDEEEEETAQKPEGKKT